MKKLALISALAFALATVAVCTAALAANFVTQAVFGITSSATTSTPNLRVQPMGPKSMVRDDDRNTMQTYVRQANTTQNLYLTKTKTVDLSSALCLYIEVDQDTKMYLNSETAYILLPSGTREVQCFK